MHHGKPGRDELPRRTQYLRLQGQQTASGRLSLAASVYGVVDGVGGLLASHADCSQAGYYCEFFLPLLGPSTRSAECMWVARGSTGNRVGKIQGGRVKMVA